MINLLAVVAIAVAGNFDCANNTSLESYAEQLRTNASVELLGKDTGQWWRPAKLQLIRGPQSRGSCSMTFSNGEVFGFDCIVRGTDKEMLEDGLPHEITHMVLATHFRKPVPRWADEGLACLAESENGANNYIGALRGLTGYIPTRQLFALTEYPANATAFYAQSYAITRQLTEIHGKATFVKFVKYAEQVGYDKALKDYYQTDFNTLDGTYKHCVAQWGCTPQPSYCDPQPNYYPPICEGGTCPAPVAPVAPPTIQLPERLPERVVTPILPIPEKVNIDEIVEKALNQVDNLSREEVHDIVTAELALVRSETRAIVRDELSKAKPLQEAPQVNIPVPAYYEIRRRN